MDYESLILNGDRGGFAARMGPRRRGVPTLGRTAVIDRRYKPRAAARKRGIVTNGRDGAPSPSEASGVNAPFCEIGAEGHEW
jgi:hypothetical protein